MKRVHDVGAEATLNSILTGDDHLDRTRVLQRKASSVDGHALLAGAERHGIGYVCPGEGTWPEPLLAMDETLDAGVDAVPPPLGLWFQGAADVSSVAGSAVAVVGARSATRYGERVASDLGSDLAIAGWAVVSGAAYGIDAAAHRGALALGGTTVAVLAGGVDVPYPRQHAGLLDRVAEHGVVLSEAPPGAKPMRSWFLSRNRIIAALSAGTVVVEAALRSGALNTAGCAAKLSREVLAVPGPVTSSLSAGCHELVREKGATLVTDACDIVDAVGAFGVDAAPARRGEERPFDRLPPDQQLVRELLDPMTPTTPEELARGTGLSPSAVQKAADELRDTGWVEADEAGWRLPRGGA